MKALLPRVPVDGPPRLQLPQEGSRPPALAPPPTRCGCSSLGTFSCPAPGGNGSQILATEKAGAHEGHLGTSQFGSHYAKEPTRWPWRPAGGSLGTDGRGLAAWGELLARVFDRERGWGGARTTCRAISSPRGLPLGPIARLPPAPAPPLQTGAPGGPVFPFPTPDHFQGRDSGPIRSPSQ